MIFNGIVQVPRENQIGNGKTTDKKLSIFPNKISSFSV